MKNKPALKLLEKYHQGNCTEAEKNLLEYWAHHLNEDGDHGLTEPDLKGAEAAMWAKINVKEPARIRVMRWPSVAAAIIVFAALAVLFKVYIFNGDRNLSSQADSRLANTIKVGGNKAVLTLANGKKVVLDDLATSHITDEDGVRISKTNTGHLVYSFTGNKPNVTGKISYNTLTTPKGGQYQVNLPDGTKVWLNAATTLRFPLTFQKNSRLVELTGEGYFEVKHLKPVNGQKINFKVKTSGKTSQVVEVLGTHFNINAYANEDAVKTTLLEGSVLVSPLVDNAMLKQNAILKPGQQAILAKTHLAVVKTDVEDVVAWKNGYFRFNDESLESIMRKVERWYDVDVKYDDESLKKISFAGVTTRFANVAELLKMLELTGEVKFRINGNSIVVLGKK